MSPPHKRVFLLWLLLSFVEALLWASPPELTNLPQHPQPLSEPYYSFVIDLCAQHHLPSTYVLNLIWAESRNDPKAENWNYRWINTKTVTPAGKTKWIWRNLPVSWDRGFFQLNQDSLPDFSARYNGGKSIDPFDWKTNLRVGIAHLAYCRKMTGSMFGAVASMNMGERGYAEWLEGKREMRYSTKRLLELVFQ